MTIDIREAYRRALDGFGALVHRIAPGQWENPTPCAGWDVRTLVNHVVSESLCVPELFAGRSAAEIGGAFDGDLLGDDPLKAFDSSAAAAVQATGEGGSLTAVVRLSFGDVPGAEYITELFADALIHTWDLARAIGADERLDPELVEACAAWFADAGDDYRQAGVMGDPHPVPAGTGLQARLLAAWGRAG
ncbi:TIGR03086 family protein [Planomonospora parontospora subsp. parontospora]|uniref:TIGR03086 family protein n=2 Tax=Planomonospora parontospora TaxID=58119 RepID=A0AA37BLG2_9ACTN|nr:TIGR03086 family metal-binding protein [Planomonospora parontospora]GGK89305.1 TIGR03086 family protein [Planomonospora parontospora]GII11602.1 TIGR03086 family protein [Planomonospora parontospora subsp. parontospora]